MPAQSLETDAFVLLKRLPTDAFQGLTVFSASHGLLPVMQRVPKARGPAGATPHVALDLFDEAWLMLESSNQGRTWFTREVRLIARPTDIGRSYDALRFASALAALIGRNPLHEDSREAVARLLREAFAAFGSGVRPQCKVAVTGKDHESYFFALGYHLIIRLEIKRQIIKLPRHQRFALRQ